MSVDPPVDLSFLDDITDWDNFIPNSEMNDTFLRVLEEDIHPFLHDLENDNVVGLPSDLQKENVPPTINSRFAPVVSDSHIEQLSVPFVPKNTQRNTEWALNNFRAWIEHYNQQSKEPCRSDVLESGSAEELNKFLSLYVVGTRQKDGKPYSPRTINSLLTTLLRYVREKNPLGEELNFLDKGNKQFKGLNSVCDRVYREMRSNGIGANPRKTEVFTKADEEVLWQKGVLGAHSPESLLQSVFFLNGKNFHLHGGDEHRFLRISQIQRYTNPDRYVYVEHGSKNRSGGISDFRNANKTVPIYANPSVKERCHVYLLDLYLSKLPPDGRQGDTFYLRPVKEPTEGASWYSSQPIGRNVLSQMTKNMFLKAGIYDREKNNKS